MKTISQLKIIAAGDSWFDYPSFLFTGGGIPPHLSEILNVPIPNMAHHGYGTEEMLSIRKRKELDAALPGSDILLFSGGGNDIAGDQFCIWLNDNLDGNIEHAVSWDRVDKALDLVIADYDDLVNIIQTSESPNCLLVTHGYDFPPTTMLGHGVLGVLGPWLQPSLLYCGWTDPVAQVSIIKLVLQRFNARMVQWTNLDPLHRIHIPTQGVLSPSDWGNEMHPNRSGFEKEARVFSKTLAPYIYTLLQK